VKTEAKNANATGGLVLTFATLVVAVALFLPLPVSMAPEGGSNLLAPIDLGAVLALALAAAGFWAFRKRFWSCGADEGQKLRSGLALVLLQALLLRAAVEWERSSPTFFWGWWPVEPWLWTPWFLTTGLAAMLLGSRLAVLIAVSGVLLLFLRANPGPLPVIGCLVSSLWGIVLVRRSTRRQVLRAGGGAGVLLGTVAAVQSVQAGAPLLTVAAAWLLPVLMGLIAAFAVLAFLPVMEWILGELSDVNLAEYGSDHALLDQLKEQAPGTWHHTLNVADLAEKAAAAIGARALFCRTAALYHDIGKLKDPAIFAENINGHSPHEDMDPRTSAERIIAHVSFGLDLARKHRLPKAFQEIIAEHHGVSVVRFFYAKACRQLRQGEDPEALRPFFCYAGPTPTSRESGIIALADIVEAATRSLGAKPEIEARAFLRKLIADRVADGQLAQCPLTLAELAQAENTFLDWLKARNHVRPAYPDAPALSAANPSEWPREAKAPQPA
jgi:cyclic-di-AMP phosphodiesterase PgpH